MAFNTTVQRPTGTFGVSDTQVDITLNPAVDWTRAYYDITPLQGATVIDEDLAFIEGDPLNSTTLRLKRAASGEVLEYAVAVVEFGASDDVSVTHTARTPGTYAVSVTLTRTIVKSTSFGVVQCRNYPRVYYASSTQLVVDGQNVTHAVQEIEFPASVEVRHGNFTASGTSHLEPISPAIDPTKSFILLAAEADSSQLAIFQRGWLGARFNSGSQIEFIKNQGATVSECWYSIVITPDTPVAHAELVMDSGDGVHNYSGLGDNAVNWPGGSSVGHLARRGGASSQNYTNYIKSEQTGAQQHTHSRASATTNVDKFSTIIGWGEGGAPPTGKQFRNPNLDGIGAGGPFFADPLAA